MSVFGRYPATRMRRMRRDDFSRRLMRETLLTSDHLIYPVFIMDGHDRQEPIASMPGLYRYTIDRLLNVAAECVTLGIPAIALFPVIEPALKNPVPIEAYNPQGLIPTAIRTLKDRFPQLGIMTDVALDPYTSHGQDGLMNEQGEIVNDDTVEILCRQACTHAEAGADIVAPSDMMDGRIGRIRQALDDQALIHTRILSYAAKYASCFYGPFRDAVGSAASLGKADKKTYQMDPANRNEAIREVALDIEEGADMVMVKPALAYLDVIAEVKNTFKIPTLAYQVSGEYSMIQAAAAQGWIDGKAAMLESLISCRRAGADAIVTYFAIEAAQVLSDM